jgi:hypothetical protein
MARAREAPALIAIAYASWASSTRRPLPISGFCCTKTHAHSAARTTRTLSTHSCLGLRCVARCAPLNSPWRACIRRCAALSPRSGHRRYMGTLPPLTATGAEPSQAGISGALDRAPRSNPCDSRDTRSCASPRRRPVSRNPPRADPQPAPSSIPISGTLPQERRGKPTTRLRQSGRVGETDGTHSAGSNLGSASART